MAIHDFKSQRLFVDTELQIGQVVACSSEQANYLRNVLRLTAGTEILIFNGRHGEWRARLEFAGKKGCTLQAVELMRPQAEGPDIHYLFAPLKRSRLDYMVQKATELGVARLRPVLTRYTVAERVNLDRMRANAIEAAEQCGILRIPEVAEPDRLQRVIDGWDDSRPLVFCDEAADVPDPLAALATLPRGPAGLLIGPEGGFADEEREMLIRQPYTLRLSLGPRIMRADTAAVAALALINAVVGDWRTV